MNITEIQAAVEKKLLGDSSGRRKLASRRAAIASLNQGLGAGNLLRRIGQFDVWFSTTQGDTANKRQIAHVQVHGRDVGRLEITADGPVFVPSEQFVQGAQRWSLRGSPEGRTMFREFIQVCHDRWSNRANEREIQWQLAHELASPKSKQTALRNLRPVMWNGLFAEIGVSVTRTGEVKPRSTGTLDLLVRRRGGFLVFELKKPGRDTAVSALVQAIRYAVALDIEANEDPAFRSTYRGAFEARGAKRLRFGAVAVMHSSPQIASELDAIWPSISARSSATRIDRIGVLGYTYEDGRATNWRWLRPVQPIRVAP